MIGLLPELTEFPRYDLWQPNYLGYFLWPYLTWFDLIWPDLTRPVSRAPSEDPSDSGWRVSLTPGADEVYPAFRAGQTGEHVTMDLAHIASLRFQPGYQQLELQPLLRLHSSPAYTSPFSNLTCHVFAAHIFPRHTLQLNTFSPYFHTTLPPCLAFSPHFRSHIRLPVISASHIRTSLFTNIRHHQVHNFYFDLTLHPLAVQSSHIYWSFIVVQFVPENTAYLDLKSSNFKVLSPV